MKSQFYVVPFEKFFNSTTFVNRKEPIVKLVKSPQSEGKFPMKNRLLIMPLSVLLGLIEPGLPAYSQAIPEYLQNELNRVRDLGAEANRQLEEIIYPQVQAQQAYEARLSQACNSGNGNSCIELQRIQQRRLQWMLANDCIYRTGLNSCLK